MRLGTTITLAVLLALILGAAAILPALAGAQTPAPATPAASATSNSPTVDQIRARGYEMMASAQTVGVHNLSAPVLAPDGKAIAALTVPYISLVNIPQAPDITGTLEKLIQTTRRLSELAGVEAESLG